jgi:hypothetical protein
MAASANAQQAAIPNLKGTWKGQAFGLHHSKHGYVKESGESAKLTIDEQQGRLFHGTVEWGGKTPGKDSFSGVIDKDNVTFYMAGHVDGIRIGKLDGPDALTFYYLAHGPQDARAGYVEYKRLK